MAPSECRFQIKTAARLGVCFLMLWRVGFAQPHLTVLGPTENRLVQLGECVGMRNAPLNRLRKGLLKGWTSAGGSAGSRNGAPAKPVAPPPQEYLESLDRDLKVCELSKSVVDEDQRRAMVDLVIQDIAIKADDCERFGMGRLIPVNVSTMRGETAENGWVVYWRWVPVGPLQTIETSIPGLSSPVTKAFPPGTYAFRAEKRVSATVVRKTETRTIIVGSAQSVDCPLSIFSE